MDRVPDGEWFCPQCITKVSDTPCCCMCQQQADDLWDCAKCFRCFHADCALEPTGECPKLWTCRICAPKPNQNGLMKNAKRGGKFALVRTSAKLKGRTGGGRDSMPNSCDNGSLVSATEFGQNQLLKKRQNHLEELLNVIMADLDAHKGAWPFRSPVDTKAFPMYRKVIKKPMDLASIQQKLNAHKYQNEEEFVADVELIMTNCHKFNEDDSPVGKAAQSLRRFFKRRWQELKRLQKTKISTFRRSL